LHENLLVNDYRANNRNNSHPIFSFEDSINENDQSDLVILTYYMDYRPDAFKVICTDYSINEEHKVVFISQNNQEKRIFSCLGTNKFAELKWISIVGCGIQYLPNISYEAKQLVGLDLYDNQISNISGISSWINDKKSPKLMYLDIRMNPISFCEEYCISMILSCNPSLYVVNMTRITPDMISNAVSKNEIELTWENCGKYQVISSMRCLHQFKGKYNYRNSIKHINFNNMSLVAFDFSFFPSCDEFILSNNYIKNINFGPLKSRLSMNKIKVNLFNNPLDLQFIEHNTNIEVDNTPYPPINNDNNSNDCPISSNLISEMKMNSRFRYDDPFIIDPPKIYNQPIDMVLSPSYNKLDKMILGLEIYLEQGPPNNLVLQGKPPKGFLKRVSTEKIPGFDINYLGCKPYRLMFITRLDLSYSGIQDITEISICCANLKILDISNNFITSFEPLDFTRMSVLGTLFLRNNTPSLRLSDIEYLQNLPRLKKLYIAGNKAIESESMKIFHILRGLNSIEIINNPFPPTPVEVYGLNINNKVAQGYLNHLDPLIVGEEAKRNEKLLQSFRFLRPSAITLVKDVNQSIISESESIAKNINPTVEKVTIYPDPTNIIDSSYAFNPKGTEYLKLSFSFVSTIIQTYQFIYMFLQKIIPSDYPPIIRGAAFIYTNLVFFIRTAFHRVFISFEPLLIIFSPLYYICLPLLCIYLMSKESRKHQTPFVNNNSFLLFLYYVIGAIICSFLIEGYSSPSILERTVLFPLQWIWAVVFLVLYLIVKRVVSYSRTNIYNFNNTKLVVQKLSMVIYTCVQLPSINYIFSLLSCVLDSNITSMPYISCDKNRTFICILLIPSIFYIIMSFLFLYKSIRDSVSNIERLMKKLNNKKGTEINDPLYCKILQVYPHHFDIFFKEFHYSGRYFYIFQFAYRILLLLMTEIIPWPSVSNTVLSFGYFVISYYINFHSNFYEYLSHMLNLFFLFIVSFGSLVSSFNTKTATYISIFGITGNFLSTFILALIPIVKARLKENKVDFGDEVIMIA